MGVNTLIQRLRTLPHSAASLARVDRAIEYVFGHRDLYARQHLRLIFSGGWAGAAGAVRATPPPESREAALMLQAALTRTPDGLTLQDFADLAVETDSTSTLENALNIRESGLLDGLEFDVRHPLGLITHPRHAARAVFFCRRALGLRRSAILLIPAAGPDQYSTGLPEPVMYVATRIAMTGARSDRALYRRERLLVSAADRMGVRSRVPSGEQGNHLT